MHEPVDHGNAGADHRSKRVRTVRWRAHRVRSTWQARGWELVSQDRGMVRTTMIFHRPRVARRRSIATSRAGLSALALVLVLGGSVAWTVASPHLVADTDRTSDASLDTDGDGLTDQEETASWRTDGGDSFRTDPAEADTDLDGLNDGDEAGPPTGGGEGRVVYAGWSDPTDADTDSDGLTDAVETGEPSQGPSVGPLRFRVSDPRVRDSDNDGIGDGDEFFQDMDPLSPDTDNDRLLDADEVQFGSDPTLANPDGDSYTDADERGRGYDPSSYDLTGKERVAAGEAGLKYGDCYECAIDAGLIVEQVESAEYLAGHVASGLAGYGDLRDFGLNLWKKKFLAAGLAGLGLLPIVGDSGKTVALLTGFAKRGGRAEQAVRVVAEELPTSIRTKVLDRLPSRAGTLPRELAGGPETYVVYTGATYVGITSDFAKRAQQHSRAGRTFTPKPIPGATGLSRGEARSIEQYCINQGGLASRGGQLENRINSIAESHDYQEAAADHGRALLEKIGGACPVTAPR